jgi:hypothetical protein
MFAYVRLICIERFVFCIITGVCSMLGFYPFNIIWRWGYRVRLIKFDVLEHVKMNF